jgi:hypothetical protein
MKEREVYELVDVPNDKKLITSKYVFAAKREENDMVERFKARLCARGFTQIGGSTTLKHIAELLHL